MIDSIDLQPAYLLHARPFRDSSLLLDLLTRDYGRMSAIARGVRGIKSKSKGLLQAFTPLLVSLSGRHELKTLRNVELLASAFFFKGQHLYGALYVNELLVRLVRGQEAE
ncbi:MAG: DNA repair protein RecO, partial [Pseudomonadales bacterium]|nr:DNA repair protein RecO [Pseudomonadales bacterium]